MKMMPKSERLRVEALDSYGIMDTAPEVPFDRLTRLASVICGVPISFISLLDGKRQWFKSKQGLDIAETDINIAFCRYTIAGETLMEVEDASKDGRFRLNPLVVGEPHIRFYAGYPLINDKGTALGSICVIDRNPKKLNDTQRQSLKLIADEIISQIIARKQSAELKDLERLFKLTSDFICISAKDKYFKKINPAFSKVLGFTEQQILSDTIPSFIHPDDVEKSQKEVDKFNEGFSTVTLTNRLKTSDNSYRLIDWVTNIDQDSGLMYGIGRDITEQKEIEAKFIRTKEMLEVISQVGGVGGWELNCRLQTISWSPVTKQIHEVPPDYMPDLEKGIHFYREGEHREKIKELVARAIAYGESFEVQLQIVTAKRNLKWVKAVGHAVVENGICERVYGIFQDITDQKNREEIISISEKRFRQTFDYAATGMFLSDAITGIFYEVNEAFCKLCGYTKSELLSMSYSRIVYEKDSAHVAQMLRKLITGKLQSVKIQKRLLNSSGEVVWVEMVASCVRDEFGKPLNIIGQTQDITSRIHAERKLQLSEEKHRGFFENSQGFMCTHDLEGNFLTINPAGIAMLGYSLESFTQISLFDLIAPEHRHLISGYLTNIEQNGAAHGLIRLLHKNGTGKILMYNNVLSELIDGKKFIIGNAVDITERILMERNLHKAKEMAVRNARAKDLFLANMSHEIRTPMNAIIGFANLLKETPLSVEQSHYVSYINTAGDNLLGIINDILDFSKIESGHINIENIPFSISEVMNNAVAVLGKRSADKRLLLVHNIDRKIPEMVNGDPTRLNQILLNLVNNAIKFTEEGSVQVKALLESENETNCTVHFSVVDTGIGIPKNKLETIFKRFTQADADTTRKYGGTGLGLSISKSLVELQGGKIWIESEPGVGSTFNVLLQYKKVVANTRTYKADTHQKLYSGKRIKVLLVEDNVFNQKLAMKVLENFNFLPMLATNGRHAVEIIGNYDFDVILMDLQMPEMDGYQATEIIRNVLGKDIPIIAMTAHSLVGEKEKCLAIGMNDYIPKPFVKEEVFNKIMYYAETPVSEFAD
jgi:PAS domain S-box-containing protein